MEPRIEIKDEFMVIGTQYVGSNENGEIPQMWNNEFFPRIDEIKNGINPGVFYGICSEAESGCDCGCDCGEFSYIACREVSSIDDVPEGMVGGTVPAATYAIFTHHGSLETLGDTWNYAYNTWLPSSDYELDGSYGFEYYDDRFDNFSPKSELDICIPVREKG